VSGFPSVPLGDAAVVTAMQAIGATSARRACRTSDLPLEVRGRLTELVDRGIIREGAPGSYYLYVSASGISNPNPNPNQQQSLRWRRLILTLILWLILILVPVLFIQLRGPR
jgi:hypothetical protein